MRFKDMNDVIESNSTLARNLKGLLDMGLVEPMILNGEDRRAIAYKLTRKGNKMVKLIREMKKL